MSKAFVEVPGKVWLVILIGVGLGWLSSNPALTSASLLILPLLVFPLWLKEAPPVLSLLLFFQWIEVTLKIFGADLAGHTVQGIISMGTEENPIFIYSKEINKALWLALGGLLSLAVGMRLGIAGMGKRHEQRVRMERIQPFSIRKLFMLYVVTLVASVPLTYLAWRFLPLSQILLALMNIKWAIFFLLGYSVWQRKKEHHFLIIAFLLEIITGFLAYFAQFKNAIFLLGVIFLTLHFRFRAKHILVASMVFLTALLLGSVWSIVKGDYRTFLDEAAVQSTGSVPLGARIEKMSSLIAGLNGPRLRRGAELLTERIAYVDFFAQVLQFVPRWIPYEQGRLWKRALHHVVIPRLFFPDKPSLMSDSDITRRYTGIRVAGGELGGNTSIGIGYFAESYVDFGTKGMFLPLFLMGLFQGFIYRYFVLKTRTKIFGYAVVVAALLFTGASIATNSTKLLGGTLMNFIIMAIFAKLFEKQFIRHTVLTSP